MNTTTSQSTTHLTTTLSSENYYSFFTNTIVMIRFYQIGYPITFILGFFGNFASLTTFSRANLRRGSTGCLFIILAVSDTIFLLVSIIDFLEFGLQISFYKKIDYHDFCRFRSFTLHVSQVLSAWILVTISMDRWIRTRFPFKSAGLCKRKNALLVVGILFIVDIGLFAQLLSPLFGMLIPGFALLACGPTIQSGYYLTFYFLNWSIIRIFVLCLLPVCLMVFTLIDIGIIVRIRKRAIVHRETDGRRDVRSLHQKQVQWQMLMLMTTSIAVFLTTTLPISIYRITSPRERIVTTSILRIGNVWVGLSWFQTLNYAVNFYIHCLTSTLFRKEFRHQIRYFFHLDHRRRLTQSFELSTLHRRTRY